MQGQRDAQHLQLIVYGCLQELYELAQIPVPVRLQQIFLVAGDPSLKQEPMRCIIIYNIKINN